MSDLLAGGDEADGRLARLGARLPHIPRIRRRTAVTAALGVAVGVLVAPVVYARPSPTPLPGCVATALPKPPTGRGGGGHHLRATSWLVPVVGRPAGALTPATVRVSGLPGAPKYSTLFVSASPGVPSTLDPGSWMVSAILFDLGLRSPLTLQLDAMDAHAGAVTFISVTTPSKGGRLTSRYVRLQAPLPFLDLKPYQSAAVYTHNCDVLVTASRPTTAHRWELRLTPAPSADTKKVDYLVRRIVLQADGERPPFHRLQLDLYLGREERSAEIHVTVPGTR